MARFLLAVLIGIGATLAWQTYGDEAKQIVGPWATEMVRSRAPSLWANAPASATGSGQVSTDDAAVAQPASVLDAAATPPRAAASLDVAQQLEAMARDLAVVRGSIEQLAAKQEQIVQGITTLGLRGEELEQASGLTDTEYQSKRKKIRRRLEKMMMTVM
jgi:hypothetical protein